MNRLAGLELGGTNANLVLGRGTDIEKRGHVPVTNPADTLAAVARQFSIWAEEAPISALGIASFGPVGVGPGREEYGLILKTTKPGWEGADVIAALAPAIAGPVAIQTDVTGAALAEGRWGAARGCSDHCYMTIGTGIGVGIVAAGQPLSGQLHPEAGHMRVRRRADDRFAGSCSFHGDCLEGLASGPAIEARTGVKGATVPDNHPAFEYVIEAIAESCATLLMTLATERIVIGGGVINQRPWMVARIAEHSARLLNGYLPFVEERAPVVAAELGADAGMRGALLIAEQALHDA